MTQANKAAESASLRGLTVLVTGGAGFIGSHCVLALVQAGCQVVVLDDLSSGQRACVPDDVPFVEGRVQDRDLVAQTLARHRVDAVIHFAGSLIVPESVVEPLKYYANNTCASRRLIDGCVAAGIKHFIFSSTAAVYGEPRSQPVSEDAPTVPLSPYGSSKLMTEWILRDVAAAENFDYVAMRYFNVAGADPDGRIGQASPDATHLIKVACQAVAGTRRFLEIYGLDYDTPDGTCVRDYIHVSDLAAAHVDALAHLVGGGASLVLNCGYGRGYSVREVLDVVQREAGITLDIRTAPRRAGDPPILVADVAKIHRCLPWRPRFDDLSIIVRSALAWESKQHREPAHESSHESSHGPS